MGIAPTIAFLISAVIMIAFLFALWYVLFRKPKPVTAPVYGGSGGSGGSAYSPPARGGSGGVGGGVRPLREAPRRDDGDGYIFYDGYTPLSVERSAPSHDNSSADSGGSSSDGGGGGGE